MTELHHSNKLANHSPDFATTAAISCIWSYKFYVCYCIIATGWKCSTRIYCNCSCVSHLDGVIQSQVCRYMIFDVLVKC